MSDLSTQVFEAIQGDVGTIQSLAGAIASNDPARIRRVLSEKGLKISDDESSALLDFTAGGGAQTGFATFGTFGT